MTVKELIEQEQVKHPGKEIGNDIALEIWETNSSDEIYFEENRISSGQCDYSDLVDAKVKSWEYLTGFGYDDKVVKKLKIEVE